MHSTWRHRSTLVGLCLAALLLLGFAAQRHALWHALNSLAQHDPLAGHTLACDQCLQFAAADAALPSAAAAVPPPAPPKSVAGVMTLDLRGPAFTAYAARAPPRED